jgi:hypothetical protein
MEGFEKIIPNKVGLGHVWKVSGELTSPDEVGLERLGLAV